MTLSMQHTDKYGEILRKIVPFSFSPDVDPILHSLPEALGALERVIDTKSVKMRMKAVATIGHALGISPLSRFNEQFLLLEASFILLMASNSDVVSQFMSMEEFLNSYEDFKYQSTVEQEKLLAFRNMMVVAVKLIPPKLQKAHLLDIVTRITEGREVKYITGGGQTPATSRRVVIYEDVGEIMKVVNQVCFVDVLL